MEPEHFYTSALATAGFLSSQRPGGSAYVIGEPGLIKQTGTFMRMLFGELDGKKRERGEKLTPRRVSRKSIPPAQRSQRSRHIHRASSRPRAQGRT